MLSSRMLWFLAFRGLVCYSLLRKWVMKMIVVYDSNTEKVLENDLRRITGLSDPEHQEKLEVPCILITRNAGAGENSLVYQTLYQRNILG